MTKTKHIGRIGALAIALGVGFAAAPVSEASATDTPLPDTTALILCGTTCPKPDQFWIDSVMTQYIKPTHPDQTIAPVGVTAPMEFWPVTGLFRVILLAVGPSELWGPGGPGWPDEPLWKLSGLFDLTADRSLEEGVAALEKAIADNPDEHLVIYGNSQGAGIANVVKKRLAEQYPEGTDAPDIDFVLGGDPNLPNGGLAARFAGIHIPILNLTMNGPAATDTQFDTVEINRQYDGFSDFPLYPLNFIADLNAVLGVFYVHAYGLDISLPAKDPTKSPAYQGKYGDTSYYLFETQDLPLFGPLRTLGVPEPVIDVFEPFFREVVELGYDRSIKPWEPTPARLVPRIDPVKAAGNFVDAISEGIDNARALVKPPTTLKAPAALKNTDTDETVHDTDLLTNESIGAVESDPDGRTTVRSPGHSNESTDVSAGRGRPTPLRDAVRNVSSGIKKVVADVSDGIKKIARVGERKDTGSQAPDATNSG